MRSSRRGNAMQSATTILMNACLASLVAFGVLNMANVAYADMKSPRPVKQADDGSIKMGALDAKIQGPNARLEGGDVKNIMWWTSVDTFLRWTASVRKPGHYRVEMTYSIIGTNNGSPLAIMVGDQVVKAIPKAGNGFDDYKTAKAGEVAISKAGDVQVVVRPLEKSREFVIVIRNVSLLPAETPSEAVDISGTAIKQANDGSFEITAGDAQISGVNAQLETGGDKNIGYWSDVGTSLIWSINVAKPGNYRVELNYSLVESCEGSKVAISVGDQTVKAKPKPTKAWTDYKTGNAGEVTISKPGDLPVVVKPISKPFGFVMNLRSVALRPVETPTDAIDISDSPIAQKPDGTLDLNATNAEIDGQSGRQEGGEEKYLVWWNSPDRFIRWPVKLHESGTFRVQLTYSLAKSSYSRQIEVTEAGKRFTTEPETITSDSSEVVLGMGDKSLVATLKAGSGWDDYKTETLGEIAIDKPGELEVVLKSPKALGALVMHLRSVTFVPKAGE